jgi:hypothetical protein
MSSFKKIIKSFINENPDIDKDEIKLNVNEIMVDAINSNKHLYNKTVDEINAELFEGVYNDDFFYQKMKNNYRIINNVDELHNGKYIRWFKFSKTEVDENNEAKLVLSNGGIFNGYDKIAETVPSPVISRHRIKCRIHNFFHSFIFEETIVFQKLALQELIMLQFGGGGVTTNDTDDDDDDDVECATNAAIR